MLLVRGCSNICYLAREGGGKEGKGVKRKKKWAKGVGGVVLGRAATTLRSIETQPFDWMICSCQLDKLSEHQAGLFFFSLK